MKKLFFLLIILSIATAAFPQKYVKVWSDEFNTKGLPDSTKWDYEVGKSYNNELQYYTNKRKENARIEDTTLIIELRKEQWESLNYTSARLVSRYKGDWLYGKFEISAKVPEGLGTWPAIWMMPTDDEYGSWPRSGEIDIMEYVGMNPDKLYYTTHFEGTNGSGHQSSGYNSVTSEPYKRFIKFTMIWTPTKIEWFADGVRYHVYNKLSDDPRVWPFNKLFHMILNFAYGGDWGGQQGLDDTKLPNKFEIDYVRVYQLQESESPFSLTINQATGGTVEVSPKLDVYPEGAPVTLTAIPAYGYEFDKWLHVGSANPVTIDMVNNLSVIPVFKKKNEMILNGDFSDGTKSWAGLWFFSPATTAATSSVVSGVYTANVTKPGTENWHIVDQQMPLLIEKGYSYQVTFDAKADRANTMDLFLSKNYGDYGAYFSTVKNITTTWQKFTWTIKMTANTDANCRFGFGFGKFQGKVYLDNVSFEKVALTSAPGLSESGNQDLQIYPNPTSGEVQLAFAHSHEKPVTVQLFNLKGQLVTTILTKQILNAGQQIRFNLNDRKIGKGIYLLKISTSEKNMSGKLVVN
ncbi:MAG: family 16 glycosylhydrolase [Prolixibacteraceae bacterium]